MERPAPKGWSVVDRYHMTHGALSICRVYIHGDMIWELWNGKKMIFNGRDVEGAYAEAVMIAQALEEVAA